MNEIAYSRLHSMAATPEALERSICYIESHICALIKKRERVLICFSNDRQSIGYVMEQAVLRCGAVPVIPEDLRWKTLLREAFSKRCSMIVGTPLLVLGLAKLARRMETPLFVRNVILAGYPCTKWMIEGIKQGLDCKIQGCYDPGAGSVIAGFSCDESSVIHLRCEEYGVEIVDAEGNPVPSGETGEVVIYSATAPEIRLYTGDTAKINAELCECDSHSLCMFDFDSFRGVDPDISRLGAQLHLWTSILDCRFSKSECGLELEIVTFPGEKLPKLPSCAKLVIRNWDPEHDVPFPHMQMLKNRHFPADNS